jgi:DNA ligase (NAD+)
MKQALKAIGDVEALSREELETQIRHHNRLYWEQNAPEISDYDYDRLVVRLRQIAPESPVLDDLGDSSERLGEPVQHQRPMLSLDKCYSEPELNDWAEKISGEFLVMPKFDGIACSLRYDEQGRLTLAATRGSGVVGDDVTVNARTIKDVPSKISEGNVEVRGEVYMKLSVFERFKEQFSNPRNLTAGAMKQKDVKKSASYGLSFATYDVFGPSLSTEREKFAWLSANGFTPIQHLFVKKDELQKGYEEFASLRPTLDFEIDGVVFRANELSEQSRLGLTAHHPRYAIAYKFQGESGRTKLEAIEWSVSRTGAITPVAIIRPVQLSGASVSRASLHHPGFVKKLGLTRNCDVLVTRRGGVIPNVEQVVAPGDEPLPPPSECPSCGQPTRWDGDFLFCSRPNQCRVAQIGELEHFCAVTEMLGFGEKVLAEAWDKGLIRTPADLYNVTVEQLSQLERVGEKLAKKLVSQVDVKRELPLAVFLRALGVAELGNHVSALLAQKYGDLARIRTVTVAELAAIHSVGEIIARSVVEGLADRAPLINELVRHVTLKAPENTQSEGPLKGRSFVFTGKLEAMDRKVAQDEVRKLGADTPSSVGPGLSYLVIGVEKDGEKSSKQKSAEKHIAKGAPIQILNEAEFLSLLDATKKGDVATNAA